MATGNANTHFVSVPGVRLGAVAAGIRADGRNDLVLMEFAAGSTSAGVFTRNLFAAAPVQVGRRHLESMSPRYFLINSGNANAGVGDAGIADALHSCESLARVTGVRPEEIIPFSTGVIGERLPVDKIEESLDCLVSQLAEDNWLEAARGIMTTDTRPKIASRQTQIRGKTVTITGMAKGAGMIQPDMATMLAYIVSDVVCSRETLDSLLKAAVERSFNRVTIDSDTSTNDSTMLTATRLSGVDIDRDEAARNQFFEMLGDLCVELAQGIVRDAEGATKFVTIAVKGGKNSADCLKVAYSIANSPLMKTAIYASDANWGRIVMAIGKSGVDLETSNLDVYLGDVRLMANGQKDSNYTEEAGSTVMAREEITITVDLNAGEVTETVWTSDLSHEYVRINAEYRT